MRALKILGIVLLVLALLFVAAVVLLFLQMNLLGSPGAAIPTYPVSATEESPSTGGGGNLDDLNAYLDRALPATFAHNVPPDMQVGKESTIELLMDLTLTEEQVQEKIREAGEIFSQANVLVMPEVKAELRSSDPEAFTIVSPLDPVRQRNTRETIRWAWIVTPQEAGPQTLIIDVSRRILVNGEEKWETVSSYNPMIRVEVAPRYPAYWTWIGALLVLGMAAAAFLAVRSRVRQTDRRARPKGRPVPEPAGAKRIDQTLGCVLISYRRSDSADAAGRIYDRLVEEFGEVPIFKDVDSIPLGIDFKQHLEQKVGESSVVLALIGDGWLNAADEQRKRRLDDPEDFVRIEIESALKKGIPVIPLLVRGARMPEEEQLPASLRSLVYMNGLPIRPDPDFHNDMDRLIAAIHKYI